MHLLHNKMEKLRKIGKALAYHIVDTTALNTAANPIIGGLEVTAYGMSEDVSLNARLFASVVGYLGVASLLSRGRDLSRSIFKINDKTKEKVQQIHDGAFIAAFNAFFAPIMYAYSGETDFKKIVYGTLGVIGATAILGGYSIDVFRDLTGLKDCERSSYPDLIKKNKPSLKKGLAAFLVGASIAINAGIYALTPNKDILNNEQQIAITHSIENNSRYSQGR